MVRRGVGQLMEIEESHGIEFPLAMKLRFMFIFYRFHVIRRHS